MILYQFTPFKPLMRKLIPSATITMRAGKHNIPGFIRPAARQGHYVVNLVLAKLLMAPITLPFLSTILSLYISIGIPSLRAFLACVPIAMMYANALWISSTIAATNRKNMLSTSRITTAASQGSTVSTNRNQAIPTYCMLGEKLYGCRLDLSALGAFFKIKWSECFVTPFGIVSLRRCIDTLFALSVQSPLYSPVMREVFFRCRFYLPTVRTSSVSWRDVINRSPFDVGVSLSNVLTYLAHANKSIAPFPVVRCMKKLSSCGFNLLTFTALLISLRNMSASFQLILSPQCCYARSALMAQSIFCVFARIEELCSSGKLLLTACALFISFWGYSRSRFQVLVAATLFALSLQPVCTVFACMKVLWRSGKLLLTDGAAFQGDIRRRGHRIANRLSFDSLVVGRRQGGKAVRLFAVIDQITTRRQSIIQFFPAACKAEGGAI